MTAKKKPEDLQKRGRKEKWTAEAALKLVADFEAWLLESPVNLFFTDYCRQNKGIYPQLQSDLKDKFPEFSENIKRLEGLRKDNLCKSALTGKFNPTFSIFYAKNEFGMTDKQNHELTGKDGAPLFGSLNDYYGDANEK